MYAALYDAYDKLLLKEAEEKRKLESRSSRKSRSAEDAERRERKRRKLSELPAFSSMLHISDMEDEEEQESLSRADTDDGEQDAMNQKMDGFERMRQCRLALDALDSAGWKRSYHQRLFHEAYIAACARPFWKLDPPGSFARAHQKILDVNNWDNLAQEILISTPRRFGKTISVSMFAAALMFSCAGCEVSIYSTCKRISTKLLRNVVKFLHLIYDVLKCEHLKVIRANQEEVHLQGPEGPQDVRVIQSYPSKVIPAMQLPESVGKVDSLQS